MSSNWPRTDGVMLSHAPRGDGAPALSNAAQRAKSQGHNPVYDCFGQTQSGRYLFCVVIAFPDGNGFLVTARPMATQETRRSRMNSAIFSTSKDMTWHTPGTKTDTSRWHPTLKTALLSTALRGQNEPCLTDLSPGSPRSPHASPPFRENDERLTPSCRCHGAGRYYGNSCSTACGWVMGARRASRRGNKNLKSRPPRARGVTRPG
jgi:hypothetical protein